MTLESACDRSPIAVGINVVADDRGTRFAWAVAASNDYVHATQFRGETSLPGFLAAFEHVLTHEAFAERKIDLYCADVAFLAEIFPFTAAWPRVTVHPWTPERDRGLLIRRALSTARRVLHPKQSAVNHPPSLRTEAAEARKLSTEDALAQAMSRPVLVAATDGSTGRCTRVSGFGWITSEGHHGQGTTSGNILLAELAAISSLLGKIPLNRRLRVLVDSTDALRFVEMFRNGADTSRAVHVGPSGHSTMLTDLAKDVFVRRDRVTFEWVRAHSGHHLNEGADRLAVQARRAVELDLARDIADATARQIVADTMRDLNASEQQMTG